MLTIKERADAMAAWLKDTLLFDAVERTGEAGIRVKRWIWSDEKLTGYTETAIILVT